MPFNDSATGGAKPIEKRSVQGVPASAMDAGEWVRCADGVDYVVFKVVCPHCWAQERVMISAFQIVDTIGLDTDFASIKDALFSAPLPSPLWNRSARPCLMRKCYMPGCMREYICTAK